ncbi:unnamed protein product [Cuscuta campestris]|uniref:Uncharacterized protein n=1 Tax=Cuscuta campestris TaxID=132261 RepID=A0A484LXE9_9ASTE|nr:unnamed protein product [Cuscuta campestris]
MQGCSNTCWSPFEFAATEAAEYTRTRTPVEVRRRYHGSQQLSQPSLKQPLCSDVVEASHHSCADVVDV